jgi:transposase
MTLPSPRPTPKPSRPPQTKRRRGGQPGNQNARKTGVFSIKRPAPLGMIRLQVKSITNPCRLASSAALDETQAVLEQLDGYLDSSDVDQVLAAHMLVMKVVKLRQGIYDMFTPLILKQRALESIARDPLGWFESTCRYDGISRDADSFFPVLKLSARNSRLGRLSLSWQGRKGLPPNHPNYATNLTDEQWALIAPLIPPPGSDLDWFTGQPPVLIAANRWGFTRHTPGSDFADWEVMQRYNEVIQNFPALLDPPRLPAKKRGRPRSEVAPRAMLDAVFWKLATGRNWDELPYGFPSMRLCRKYYRRLYRSGRLYTILLALYDHLRLEAGVDTLTLLEQGVFTTTPGQNIALSPGVPPTWQNYTALLFMQLAREAWSRMDRIERRRTHRGYLPVLQGSASLSTAELPEQPPPYFVPLEDSLAAKRFWRAERNTKTFERMISEYKARGKERGKK